MAKNLSSAAKSSSTKAPRAPRAKKVAADVVTLNSAEVLSVEDDLDTLLAALSADTPKSEVIADAVITESDLDAIEPDLDTLLADPVMLAEPVETEISLEDLETAVTRAEAVDAMMATATVDEITVGSAPSEADPEAVPGEVKAKRVVTPRKHYTDKVERLKDRVGAELAEYTVLTTADALVDEAELTAVMERTLEIIREMNSKQKNRASNLIEFLSGKRARLNNVLERVLRVLDRDGVIQTGNEGNVMKDLLARPYSPASARAMGGNTIGMYADLKLIVPDGKGKFVANPDSLLLAKARSMLAAMVPGTEGADDEAAEPAAA